MTTAYQDRLGSLHWIDQVRRGGFDYGTPASFEATGAGTTGTIVSTTLGASIDSNDDFVGYVVECVRASDDRNVGLRRRIVAVDDVTHTLTVDAFPVATTTNDAFLLLLPPWPVIAADAAEAAPNEIQDATRSEANDYWNGTAQEGGPRIEVVKATNLSTADRPLVSDFVSLNGVFTPAVNFSGNAAVGDSAELWCDPQILNDAFLECPREPIERKQRAGEYGTPGPVAGLRSAQGTLELAFAGPGRGREGLHAELHRPLKCVYSYTDAENSTVAGSSAVDAIKYSVGNHDVGDGFVTEGGDCGLITADSGGDTYTPSPNLSSAPSVGETLYGLTTYVPRIGAAYDLAAKQWRGNGILEYVAGILPIPQFNGSGDDFLRVSLDCAGSDWVRLYKDTTGTALERPFTPRRRTVNEQKLGDMRLVIGSTTPNLIGFSFNPGFDRQSVRNTVSPNRSDGHQIVGDDPRGELHVLVGSDTVDSLDDFLSGREQTLLIQCNRTPGYPGVWALWAYKVQYTGVPLEATAGLVSLKLPFKVNAHTTTTLPRYAIMIG